MIDIIIIAINPPALVVQLSVFDLFPDRRHLLEERDSVIEIIDKGEEIHDEVDEGYYYTYAEEGDDSSEENNEDE